MHVPIVHEEKLKQVLNTQDKQANNLPNSQEIIVDFF